MLEFAAGYGWSNYLKHLRDALPQADITAQLAVLLDDDAQLRVCPRTSRLNA